MATCAACNGTGQVTVACTCQRVGCDRCNYTGTVTKQCQGCNGTGSK